MAKARKVIVAGGRDFSNKEALFRILGRGISVISEVVCGTARGADSLGEEWAKENNAPVKKFFPDWKGLGRSAGAIRNQQMGDYADALIAFWDGKSRGTKHMIDYMISKGKHMIVFDYSGNSVQIPEYRGRSHG